MPPKMVYDEAYGDLTYAQRACYRKHNVPPAMHDQLVRKFDDPAQIVAFVNLTVARNGRIDYIDTV